MVGVGRRLLRGQRSLEAAARRVEAEFPELGSNLINLVQLSEDRKNVDRAFCEAAVDQAAAQIGHGRLRPAPPTKESRWRRFLHCMQTPRDLAESLGVLALLVAAGRALRDADSQLGFGRLATAGAVGVRALGRIGRDRQRHAGQYRGAGRRRASRLPPRSRIPTGKPHRATLFVAPEGEPESQLPMAADEKHQRYKLTVPSVLKPFAYRLEIGDSQTQVYAVGVREKPVDRGGRGDVPLSRPISAARARRFARRAWTSKRRNTRWPNCGCGPSTPDRQGLSGVGRRAVRRPRRGGRQAAGRSACPC